MRSVINLYKNAYSGLSHASWLLAFITFINRSGMMVLPFIGLYLTEDLHFSVQQTGIILSFFGVGSMIGSFLGGYLSDRAGYFKVVLWSLILGGFSYIALIFLNTLFQLCAGVLIATIITDSLRPAMSGSIASYNSGDKRTRSVSLLRMAINLGASIGPALGGLLAVIGYFWIFIGDGLTSITAGIAYYFYFRRGKYKTAVTENKDVRSGQEELAPAVKVRPYHDILFMLFIILAALYATVFFQLFNTIPLYYRNIHHLSEPNIGLLIAMNGIIVFSCEMIIVYSFENRFFIGSIILTGILLCAAGILILNLIEADWILYVSMVLLSLSEILVMPFMMTVAMSRAPEKSMGVYIGTYSMGWGAAFILAPLLGTFVVEHYSYTILFYAMAILCALVAAGVAILVPRMYATKQNLQLNIITE